MICLVDHCFKQRLFRKKVRFCYEDPQSTTGFAHFTSVDRLGLILFHRFFEHTVWGQATRTVTAGIGAVQMQVSVSRRVVAWLECGRMDPGIREDVTAKTSTFFSLSFQSPSSRNNLFRCSLVSLFSCFGRRILFPWPDRSPLRAVRSPAVPVPVPVLVSVLGPRPVSSSSVLASARVSASVVSARRAPSARSLSCYG